MQSQYKTATSQLNQNVLGNANRPSVMGQSFMGQSSIGQSAMGQSSMGQSSTNNRASFGLGLDPFSVNQQQQPKKQTISMNAMQQQQQKYAQNQGKRPKLNSHMIKRIKSIMRGEIYLEAP